MTIIIKYKRLFITFTLIISVIIYCFFQNTWIQVENIDVRLNKLPKELNGLKIVQVSDVHLRKDDSGINRIINKVKNQKPDIIVITGDIVNADADLKTCGLGRLCRGLSGIAKTYAVTGNHEFRTKNVGEWTNILTINNVQVIDDKIAVFTKNNKSIAILGLADGEEYKPENFTGISGIKDFPIILLAHRPELFISSYSADTNMVNPDIVFSGHAHGGQFRIPFINKGLYAPNQGLFPKFTSGIYNNNNVKMVVSRGLGNSIFPIRLNNTLHLPVIHLEGDS